MRIKFDYNNVEPQTVLDVLTEFIKKYEKFKLKENSEEIGHIEFGSINLYISLRCSTDNKSLNLIDNDNQEVMWTVKPYKMKKTNKKEIYSTDNFTIYQNKERK